MQFNMRILPLLFLLLGLVSSSYSETCPEEDKLRPCTCKKDEDSEDLLVDCDEITLESLKNSLNSLSGKENVDLVVSDINLGTLPSTMFNGIGITKLYISHCDLDSLSEGDRPALLGLENSLEELSIVSSFTEDNTPTIVMLDHMRKLKEIDLSFNAITELSNEWFERGPASLEILTISNNAVGKIGNRAFASLVNLQQLSIDGNRFGPIQRSMFPNPANSLERLELDNNALTAIPDDLFTNMPALEKVSLRENGILRLDQTTWQRVWQQLDGVWLEGNYLECDSNMDWIFSMERNPAVYGQCSAPRALEGKDIQDMINNRSRG